MGPEHPPPRPQNSVLRRVRLPAPVGNRRRSPTAARLPPPGPGAAGAPFPHVSRAQERRSRGKPDRAALEPRWARAGPRPGPRLGSGEHLWGRDGRRWAWSGQKVPREGGHGQLTAGAVGRSVGREPRGALAPRACEGWALGLCQGLCVVACCAQHPSSAPDQKTAHEAAVRDHRGQPLWCGLPSAARSRASTSHTRPSGQTAALRACIERQVHCQKEKASSQAERPLAILQASATAACH